MVPVHHEPVERLIDEFAQLPGIGRRSAERMAFHILKSSKDEAARLTRAIDDVKSRVNACSICFNLTDSDPCRICADPRRDASLILVVEQFKDGEFVTRAGASPGGCEGGNVNPPQIPAGLRGKMQGQFWIRVSNGVFNPNANPGTVTTAQFVQAVFGPTATYQVYSFSLNYTAKNRGDWRNASADKGGNQGNIR